MQTVLVQQRNFFNAGHTISYADRRHTLKHLHTGLKQHEDEILDALYQHLGKSPHEAYMSELGLTLAEIRHALKHLKGWMRPKRRRTPLANFPATQRIYAAPYGVVLIIAPWNYPLLLSLAPLVGALAAGNCAIIKPSELAPATAEVLAHLIREAFPEEYVAVVNGAVEVSKALLDEPFDYIFYTGNGTVGQYVMERAAAHLTPVTLELGGKSPVVVTQSANLALAARRIVFGKYLNCGQTCIAPDYVLVEKQVHAEFVHHVTDAITKMYGTAPLKNPSYGHIINSRHFERLCRLLLPEKIVHGGEVNAQRLQIAPTVMNGVDAQDAVMQEEIFGPILPILEVNNLDEAYRFIHTHPRPLALYLFTQKGADEKLFLEGLQFGGGCVNDVISHIVPSNLPFGGVGASGIGAYHGASSFQTFSHPKSIVRRKQWWDPPVRYLPYKNWKTRLLRRML